MTLQLRKVALVTGAASGIGKATAYAFAQEGHTTVVADVNEEAGHKVLAEIRAREQPGLFVRCDVSNESEVDSLVDRIVDEFGQLDVAFNNAGIEGEQESTADGAAANFDRVIATNLRGVWLCMRAEIRQMLKQQNGGSIVNCASVAGLIGLPEMGAYVASKHGVIGLTRTAALETATRKIRVNAVCPGAIETPMLQRYMTTEQARRQIAESEPVGRIGTPEEIASAVLWLSCGGASFVTGQALAVDGGWTAR
jgi:NAD(P)-dependent dehydrogenase (short-subunit alcohol dehydrogenase family)